MLRKGTRVLSKVGLTKDHCVCGLDCDDYEIARLKENLENLMTFYDLGSFYLFKTSKDHYSAVCFSIVTPKELREIMTISWVDIKQIEALDHLKTIGFRISKKHGHLPIPFGVIKRKSKSRKNSSTHIAFFNGLYPLFINEKRDGEWSGITFETFENPKVK